MIIYNNINEIQNTNIAFLIDESVYRIQTELVNEYTNGRPYHIIQSGEASKTISGLNSVIQWLIEIGADRNTTLVGIGGGVVTDLTGFVGSIWMRGVRFGFVPTTLLNLVDASIGGKNGINIGQRKNQVGCIRQPEWIIHDFRFLDSVSDPEWCSGFSEVIKHSVIADADLFGFLEDNDTDSFRKNHNGLLEKLVNWNVKIKSDIVEGDVYEADSRRILNYGHTLGHAIETLYGLKHGFAVSIGMAFSLFVHPIKDSDRILRLISKYGLPTWMEFDPNPVMELILSDKKQTGGVIGFVVANGIGNAEIRDITTKELKTKLEKFLIV